MTPDEIAELRARGIGREKDDERTLFVFFNRRPTDDEMRRVHDLLGDPLTLASRAPPAAADADAEKFAPTDKETRDQMAAVMLQHGTPEQQREAAVYAGFPAAPDVGDGADAVAGLVTANDEAAAVKVAVLALASRIRKWAKREAYEECLACQPSTAENPNEDAYQRGRFDGVMEFARNIVAKAAVKALAETRNAK